MNLKLQNCFFFLFFPDKSQYKTLFHSSEEKKEGKEKKDSIDYFSVFLFKKNSEKINLTMKMLPKT